MGDVILERVLEELSSAGFRADLAYPGRIIPQVTETVAAVHIGKADLLRSVMTLEVTIISPEKLGGAACELQALRAMEALTRLGGVCSQQGCDYDSRGQVYMVTILADFIWLTGEHRTALGPDVEVVLEDTVLENAVAFTAQREFDFRLIREMGETAATDVSRGIGVWKLRLEEMLPLGNVTIPPMEKAVTLRLRSPEGTETFRDCCWITEQHEYTAAGLRRIRTGIARSKENEYG